MKLVRSAFVAFAGLSCAPRVEVPASMPTVVVPPAEATAAPASATLMTPVRTAAVTTVDIPKAVELVGTQVIFAIQVRANGDIFVDSTKIGSDGELLNLARRALGKNPELRAVIQADQAVAYGRVIHVLDVLKQGGIAKIAFGVSTNHRRPLTARRLLHSAARPPIVRREVDDGW